MASRILLFDPSDYFYHFKYVNKFIDDSFDNELAVIIIDEIFIALSDVPDELLFSIKKIILVNPNGSPIQITPEIYKNFLQQFKTKTKKADYLYSLLKDECVNNFNKLGDQAKFQQNLISEYQNEEFLLLDGLLTNLIAILLQGMPHIIGYRYLEKKLDNKYEKISDIKRYLTIAEILFYKNFNLDELDELAFSKAEYFHDFYFKDLALQIKSKNVLHHVLLFNDEERNELDDFIEKLYDEFGYFYVHDCSNNNTNIPKHEKQIIVKNIEEIKEKNIRQKLLNEISKDIFQDCIIIIISKYPFEIKGFPKIKIWLDFPRSRFLWLTQFQFNILKKNIGILNKRLDEFKYLIDEIAPNRRQKNKLLKNLNLFSRGYDKVVPGLLNFWYEIGPLDFYYYENDTTAQNEVLEKYFIKEDKTIYEINLNEKEDRWIILKNGTQLKKDISYSNSKAMKYIVYLYKYYSEGKIIEYSELDYVVTNWDKLLNVKKINSEEKRKLKLGNANISSRLSDLYNVHSELREIQKCVKLSRKSYKGCYFQKDKQIEIKLDTFQMPPAI